MERCKSCNHKIEGDKWEQNAYGDVFCSTCWDIKQRFPTKANHEIAVLKPYYEEQNRGDTAELSLKLTTRIIFALFILALLLTIFG